MPGTNSEAPDTKFDRAEEEDALEKFEKLVRHPLFGPSLGVAIAVVPLLLVRNREVGGALALLSTVIGILWGWYQGERQMQDNLDATRNEVKNLVGSIKELIEKEVKIGKFQSGDEVIDHIANGLATTESVWDVNARAHARGGQNCEPEMLNKLTTRLRQWNGTWTQIVGPGHDYDQEYIQAISEAIEKRSNCHINSYRLHESSTLTEFTILNHKKQPESLSEVLFGAVTQDHADVFWCKNPEVVAWFRRLAHNLKDGLKPQSLVELVDRRKHPEKYLKGLERFWFPHFSNGLRTTIVYTEPVCFRIFDCRGNRFFLRDIDINIDEAGFPDDKTLKGKLKGKLDWVANLKEKNDQQSEAATDEQSDAATDEQSDELEISLAYIPGGEALAKDNLVSCFRSYGKYFVENQMIDRVPEDCRAEISHRARWTGPTSLTDDNLIFLGNTRANTQAQTFSKHFRYSLQPDGIKIKNPNDEEREKLHEYIVKRPNELKDNGVKQANELKLKDNWQRDSTVLVLFTRAVGSNRRRVTTSILSNQGRGVQGVSEQFLEFLKEADRAKWEYIAEKLALPAVLPDEYQMLFRVTLKDRESRVLGCDPLVCDLSPRQL